MIKKQIPESIIDLNQTSLQDFIDCPRRFQLRWIHEKSWPAANSMPIESTEKATKIGTRFHKIAQQFFLGIPERTIESTIIEPELQEMFSAFTEFSREFLSCKYYSEQLLHIPFRNYRLIAKYDLIVQTDDRFVIIDWKTSPKQPPLPVMAERVQSNLYPYIFTKAGTDLFPELIIDPDYVKFMYWYPLCSEPEIVLQCSKEKISNYEDELSNLLERITDSLNTHERFPQTSNDRQCLFCVYRSLCERGDKIGTLSDDFDLELDDYSDFQLEIDQISEMEF